MRWRNQPPKAKRPIGTAHPRSGGPDHRSREDGGIEQNQCDPRQTQKRAVKGSGHGRSVRKGDTLAVPCMAATAHDQMEPQMKRKETGPGKEASFQNLRFCQMFSESWPRRANPKADTAMTTRQRNGRKEVGDYWFATTGGGTEGTGTGITTGLVEVTAAAALNFSIAFCPMGESLKAFCSPNHDWNFLSSATTSS